MLDSILYALLVALALLAAYWWGRRVGLTLAKMRASAYGPDILVTICEAGKPPRAERIGRGEIARIRDAQGGYILVGFAKTRPLPKEVAAMLEEVTRP